VVLASMAGDAVQRVAAQLGLSRPMIWRWRQRFTEAGVEGLLRDRRRKPTKPQLRPRSPATRCTECVR
jgi:transposase